MTQGRSKNGAELKDLDRQVRKARHLVHQSELKVEAIVATIYETEEFYPKIKIIRRPVIRRTGGIGRGRFSLFTGKLLTEAR